MKKFKVIKKNHFFAALILLIALISSLLGCQNECVHDWTISYDILYQATGTPSDPLLSPVITSVPLNTHHLATHTCKLCGKIKTFEEEHHIENGICQKCGYGCKHTTYQKSYVYYNDYDHLIRYICNDCGEIFDDVSVEHAFWDVENNCSSSTCNLCEYICEHFDFNGTICTACGFVCEHEFEYVVSDTGGACKKCGSYCCTHKNMKLLSGINSFGCPDCGLLYYP